MLAKQIDHTGIFARIKSFIKDEKNAILLKLLIYCFHGGSVVIFTMIVLHMQMWGISLKEIAVIALIQPISSLLGPVFSGLLADKFGKYGKILVVNILLMILFYDLLLVVPFVQDFQASTERSGDSMLLHIKHCNKCFRNVQNDTLQLEEIVAKGLENPENSTSQLIEVSLDIEKYESESCLFSVTNKSDFEIEDSTWKVLNSTNCPSSIDNEYTLSFYLFLFIRVSSAFFTTAAFTMLDASIIAEAKKHNLSLGKQRIFVMLGYATTPPFAGYLSDRYSLYIGEQSFLPNFIVGSVLMMIAAFIMASLNVKVQKNDENVLKNMVFLVSRLEILLFLVMLLLLGTNFGFVESYLFLFMNSLGAPTVALGLTITSGCLASIPVLYFSDYIHEKIGREYIYFISFTGYSIRLFGYSIMQDPWIALIFEMFEAINYQLMWVTCLKFFPVLAPPGMLATMTGLSMATHYAFGQGIGAFVGGHLIDAFGYRLAFRVIALISLVSGIISFAFHRFVISKRIQKRHEDN